MCGRCQKTSISRVPTLLSRHDRRDHPDPETPVFRIAAASDGPVATRGEDEACTVAARRRGASVDAAQTRAKAARRRAAVATNLERILRLAAARGAATVYVVANAAPVVRVDGEFSTLEGEPAISTAVVERLTAEVSPASAIRAAVGRVDDRRAGDRPRALPDVPRSPRPGIIFRMVPPRAIAADQLGLSAEVQALCSEADGLVLVTGGRDSGRSTLLTSFVDLINRTRSDHIISVESQIEFVHESKRSFISQREVRGEDAMVGAVRSACREEPDVLVIEDIRSHEVASLALEAAEAGRLVFASVPGAFDLLGHRAADRAVSRRSSREGAGARLPAALRGVVAQVLLRKLRGGRVAAREVLLNTPAVAGLIMEGKTFQLSAAIENGRRVGMMSFAESLATLVREGVVHPSHAYRKAPSREQFLAASVATASTRRSPNVSADRLMEVPEIRRRLRASIEAAKRDAQERRGRSDQAARDYEQFLSERAVPLFHTVASALVAEGHRFKVFTPAGSVRLASESSGEDYIEWRSIPPPIRPS